MKLQQLCAQISNFLRKGDVARAKKALDLFDQIQKETLYQESQRNKPLISLQEDPVMTLLVCIHALFLAQKLASCYALLLAYKQYKKIPLFILQRYVKVKFN